MDGARPENLARAALPLVAAASFLVGLGLTLAAAGDTLGYDFRAYHQAVIRLVNGIGLYDMSFTEAGAFGLFFYPPPFAVLVLPFAFVAAEPAILTWVGLSIGAFLVGVAILPVSRSVRWWVVLLAGWSFPFVYAVKLGQVGPILFLLFAVGWRGIDQPIRLGVSAAFGAAIKLQPGLILGWALLTRRYRAVVAGVIVLATLGVAATLIAGPGSWADFIVLVRTVSDPITTPQNLTPGAVAYQGGLAPGVATLLQLVNTIAVVGATLAAIRWATAEASFLVVVVASQLVSPILWDHYAMLLLLPVAYLLSSGRWWALAIPLVTAWPLIGVTPGFVYPAAFWLTLIATALVGRAGRPDAVHAPAPTLAEPA